MSERAELEDLLQRGYRYALSLVHEPARAEDLLQDACLRLSGRGGPWEAPLLFRIIRNRFIDVRRRQTKIRFRALLEEPPVAPPPTEALTEELARALGELREDEREAVYLTAVEGWSTAEVAEHTDRPRGTVLSMIHRAKQKLKRSLGLALGRDAS